jgi:NAD(P)-dependent dehydrogenase (short-subunit alcohol dehydrogenase family)
VTLAVRDTQAGDRTAAQVTASTTGAAVSVGRLDLSDRASVTAFAERWLGPLDLLVNNAGVMALPTLELTPEGWEMQFATNHLGHFALALGLHPALAAAGAARIVSLSSVGHLRSPVVFEDLHFSARPV